MPARHLVLAWLLLALVGCGRLPHDPALNERPPPDTARAPEPRRGQEVALRWCSACHVVVPGTIARPEQVAAPPFAGIAADQAKDRAFLARFMQQVHPPMPTYRLFPEEKAALLAYLESLRPRR